MPSSTLLEGDSCHPAPARGSRITWPTMLLVLVAMLQVWASTSMGLSPWKGGGFGMFSTSDSPAQRRLVIGIVDADGVEHPALVPAQLRQTALECRTWPRQRCLADLAAALVELRWAPLTLAKAESEYARLTEPLTGDSPVGDPASGSADDRSDEPPIAANVLRAQADHDRGSPRTVIPAAVRLRIVQIRFFREPARLETQSLLALEVVAP